MISGFTSHKLDVVSTYSKTNPYQIGVNGVTNIEYATNRDGIFDDTIPTTAITKIHYSIDSINYVTTYTATKNNSVLNTTLKNNRKLNPTIFSTNISGYDFEPYFVFPDKQNTFDIKEEAKMGLVFPPKVINELFIERMNIAVFERHSRLSEVKTLDQLVSYRNGYYNIIENR